MEYSLKTQPFEIEEFSEMKKKDAQQHFDWYISQIPRRMPLLSEVYEITRHNIKTEKISIGWMAIAIDISIYFSECMIRIYYLSKREKFLEGSELRNRSNNPVACVNSFMIRSNRIRANFRL